MDPETQAGQLQRLTDIREIENLQGRYIYYVQSHDYDRILRMFARHDPEVSAEISSTGVYVGMEKIEALFTGMIKPLFTAPGSLPIHMLTTPVIEVDPGGLTATGMWQTLGCNAFPTATGHVAAWQQGKYDNAFVKEDGRWRFKRFRWLCNFRTAFDEGWVKQSLLDVGPLDLANFPEAMRPSRPSEPYPAYREDAAMDFGPPPPEPRP